MIIELMSSLASQETERGRILFIHGVYHAAWAWERFLPYFADHGFSSHAISLRGHGESEGGEHLPGTRFRDYLDDVLESIDRVGDAPILVGHSLGGMLIQRILEQRAFPAAVLMSTPTPRTIRGAGPRLALKYPLSVFRFLFTGNPDHIYKNREIVKKLFFSLDHDDVDWEDHLDRVLKQDESRRIIWDVSFLQFLKPAYETPVLVIGGGDDFALRRDNFEETARLYGTVPVIIDGQPHDLMLGGRWQEVADLIIDWLGSQVEIHAAG